MATFHFFIDTDKLKARTQEQSFATKDIVLYILGVLSAILTQIYSYYFGSSQGSADKNSIIQGLKGTNQQ